MRALPLAFAILMFASGCLAPQASIESAAAELAPPVEPGLLDAPRALSMPAGTSSAVARLNATADDWVGWNGDQWLFVGYEFPDGVEAEAVGVVRFKVEGDKLSWAGAGFSNGAGSGGGGASGEPGPTTFIFGISVVNASAPFELRLGAYEELGELSLEGETVPAEVLASGSAAHLSIYFEFGSAFSFLADSAPWTVGMEVEDARVHPPAGAEAAGAAGRLALGYVHALDSPGLHFASADTSTFLGARAGTWEFASTVDGEMKGGSGLYARPVASPWLLTVGAPQAEAKGDFVLDTIADVFPITVVAASSFAWDPATLGLTVEPMFELYGTLPAPIVLHTAEGCIRADAPAPPSRDACLVLG